MDELQISVSVGHIVGTVVSLVGGYIAWSARQLMKQFEANIHGIAERCEENENRLDNHEKCLTKICINHEHNHNQKVDCHL